MAQSQKDCEDLLVTIVSERRVADEQKKQVEADSERIGTEAKECKAISDDAEADLGTPVPFPLSSSCHMIPPLSCHIIPPPRPIYPPCPIIYELVHRDLPPTLILIRLT